MKNFIEELKRRNVIKATIAYLVIAWVLLQVASILLPILHSPEWVLQTFTIILIIGLPIWIVISWIYDITPKGIEVTSEDPEKQIIREVTNKRLNVFIITSLSIAVIVLTLKLTNVFTDSDKQYAIAILPFENMNSDDADEWFSDAITNDIYIYLAAVKSLRVISTKSTMKYKGADKTISEIADELGVDFLVNGDVRKDNKRVLISASLFNANDEQEWAEKYNESEEDPFAIQQAVSQKIVEELKITLSPEEEKVIEKYPTQNMEAYNLFSKGRLVNDSREKEDLEKNIELNKQAIALDPNFAEAYAEIGQSTFLLGLYWFSREEGKKNAIPYLEKALEIDSNNARALAVKGMTIQLEDYDKALKYFEKAVKISPNDATIRFQYARHISQPSVVNKKYLDQIAIAQELDPISALLGYQFFISRILSYKVEEAKQYYNKYRFLFTKPGEQLEMESILIAYKNKDWEAGLRFLETELKKDPDNAILNRKLGEAYDGILLDNDNYIKYTKKAYELDAKNLDNGFQYYFALLRGEKFAAAKNLIESKNFKSLLPKGEELNLLYEYYLAKEDYEKAEEVLKDSLMSYSIYNKLIYQASVGNRKAVDNVFKILKWPELIAQVYAILKEKDSMYYYLRKVEGINHHRWDNRSPRTGFREINSWKEFDPYRKEERFKEILRKHYLPITHWNE